MLRGERLHGGVDAERGVGPLVVRIDSGLGGGRWGRTGCGAGAAREQQGEQNERAEQRHRSDRGNAGKIRHSRSAPSWRSSHCFVAMPEAKPVSPPSALRTRWHGTTSRTGFCPTAAPAA